MIHLDVSDASVVIMCDDCPWWRALAFDREEGWRRARAHERIHHPGSQQADRAIRDTATRRGRQKA